MKKLSPLVPPALRLSELSDGYVVFSYDGDSTARSPLTAAEMEVVRLVLLGMPNAAIAARRKVSPRTIVNQLASVYRKLDVRSRSELAARIDQVRTLRSLGTDPRSPRRIPRRTEEERS